jgi:sigma-B regulation protein RsbU (phosphoserine phosphatase)
MNLDTDKTKDELIEEIQQLRRQMHDIETECLKLKKECKKRADALGQACNKRDRTEEALRFSEMIVDQSPVILFRRLAGENPKLVYVSRNINRFGYSSESFLSGDLKFKDIVYPGDTERLRKEILNYAEQDVEEYTQVYRIISKYGDIRWVEDRTSVVRDKQGNKIYNQGIVVDITERKIAEEQLRKSEEKFRRIVETAGEGFILMDENLYIVDVNDAYCKMIGFSREEILGKRPTELATESFRDFITINRDALLAQEYREFEGELVAKDGRIVPTLVHGNTLRDDQGEVIGNMAFVTDMTEHKKALALAGEVQKSLLPQEKPQIPGFDVAGKNISCDEIGGDYYDFLVKGESAISPLSVVVGDIAGHGVDAALLMTTARAFLRMRASQPGTISDIISAMNRHLTLDVLESGRFMTLFYLTLNPGKKRIEWVRAGHDPAIVYDPDLDRFEELKGTGMPLGVDERFEYQSNYWEKISDGQIIAIGTDGIWEASNNKKEMFGKKRFREIIKRNADRYAKDIVNAVFHELESFTKGQKSEDDITLVIIKVNTSLRHG